jgi:hypothetical protein
MYNFKKAMFFKKVVFWVFFLQIPLLGMEKRPLPITMEKDEPPQPITMEKEEPSQPKISELTTLLENRGWPEFRTGRDLETIIITEQVFFLGTKPVIKANTLFRLMDEYNETFYEKTPIKLLNEEQSYLQKKILLGNEQKIAFIGDLHGSIHSFLKILEDLKNKGLLDDDFKIKDNTFNMVFLGDYVDRGQYGAEVWYVLLRLKLANWDQVFLVRGNHEDVVINEIYHFAGQYNGINGELRVKYGEKDDKILMERFNELYQQLPLAIYLGIPGTDGYNGYNWIQCCHGGIDPTFNPLDFFNQEDDIHIIKAFNINNSSYNFSWGDFFSIKDSNDNESAISTLKERLKGYNPPPGVDDVCKFMVDDVRKFMNDNHIIAIFRGHQHSNEGLKMTSYKVTGADKEPIYWKYIVRPKEPKNQSGGSFLIGNLFSVFTLTTATDTGIANQVSYCILNPAPTFEKYELKHVVLESWSPCDIDTK